MDISVNFSLKNFNTFGIDAKAKYFAEVTSVQEIQEFIADNYLKNNLKLILGEGSNILLTKDIDGVVLKINNKGIELVAEDDDYYYVKAEAGEIWDDFVNYCVSSNYAGVENLSYIPGTVGAAPIQNIGAYGVELKNIFFELSAININTKKIETFGKNTCEFGYRESIFKKQKNKYIILSVIFRLFKEQKFILNYPDLKEKIKKLKIQNSEFKISIIRQAIYNLRRRKLPDPSILGNAGSFFKNPIVSQDFYNELKQKFHEIIEVHSQPLTLEVSTFSAPNERGQEGAGTIKLSAAWLIEQCGWKGKRLGEASVYDKHSLILVNYGNATGQDILHLAKEIQKSVYEKFNIKLEFEVNLVT